MSDELDLENTDQVDVESTATPFRTLLDEKAEKNLVDFVSEQLRLSELERVGEEKMWAKIRRQRIGVPEFEKKDTPWPDASNIVPPGMMIAENTIFGMTKNSMGARTPFWRVKAYREKDRDDVRVAHTIEKYLEMIAASRTDLNKREADREIHEEADLMGTVFVMVPWSTHTYNIPLPGPDGTSVSTDVVFHDGPEWVVVPREDAFYRMRERSVQSARWWMHKIELEEADVEERFLSGRWVEWDGWRKSARTEATLADNAADRQTGGVATTRNVWDFYEGFVRWQLQKDGPYIDLLVVIHREARVMVAARRNEMGVRPLREVNFIKRTRRLDGFGVGQSGTHMQSELETQHNQRMDGTHLAGLRMLVARKNCGIKPREILKPGKILFVDNVKEDWAPFQVGEMYPSSIQAESLTWSYMQKATLQTDTMAGFADATMKSRDSIGLQTNRMKASSGVIGAILETMEDAYSDIGLFTVYQLIFNKERVLENERKWKRLDEQELKDLELALSIPLAEVPKRLVFSVRTTDIEQTYEMQRQNVLTLVSIYSMFQKQNLPLMMQMNAPNPQTGQPLMDPETKRYAMRMLTGNSRLMEKVFEFFDEDRPGEYVPAFDKMEVALDIQDAMEGRLVRQLEGVRSAIERAKDQGSGGGPENPAGQPGVPPGPSGLPFPVENQGAVAGGGLQAPGGQNRALGALPGAGGPMGPAGAAQ